MSSRRRELFEILNQATGSNARSSGQANPLPGEGPVEEILPYQPKRESASLLLPQEPDAPLAKNIPPQKGSVSSSLVSWPPGALTTILGTAMMVIVAYLFGFQAGQRDLPALLLAEQSINLAEIPLRSEAEPIASLEERRYLHPVWPADYFAVKLITYPKTPQGRTRAVSDRSYASKQPILAELNLTATVLENNLAYSVCIGATPTALAPNLDKVRKHFQRLPGPATSLQKLPYAGLSIEKVRDLGGALR